jgi:hypothetical protein
MPLASRGDVWLVDLGLATGVIPQWAMPTGRAEHIGACCVRVLTKPRSVNKMNSLELSDRQTALVKAMPSHRIPKSLTPGSARRRVHVRP